MLLLALFSNHLDDCEHNENCVFSDDYTMIITQGIRDYSIPMSIVLIGQIYINIGITQAFVRIKQLKNMHKTVGSYRIFAFIGKIFIYIKSFKIISV